MNHSHPIACLILSSPVGPMHRGGGRGPLLLALILLTMLAGCEAGPVEPQRPRLAAYPLAGSVRADSGALVALYDATDGATWRHNERWLSDAPLGDWYGVSVDGQGRVTELRLVSNRLAGTIPPELGDLTNLRNLDLEGNNLTGTIPPELGDLASLMTLALGHNDLTGTIPPELGGLDSLTSLALGSNRLTGVIPSELGELANLAGLGLSNNTLSGSIPSQLGDLESLAGLYLGGNHFTGTFPSSFLQLEELYSLRVGDNDLCVPGTADFSDWLSGVEYHDAVFCNAADATVLRGLYRATGGPDWTNPWNESSVEDWHGVTVDSLGRVVRLDLTGNGLTGLLPSYLGNLKQMNTLRVGYNALTGRLPLALTGLALSDLRYTNTDLCIPADPRFQEWLNSTVFHEGTGIECAPLSDRDILKVFYAATGGPGWTTNDNWLADTPLADWYGVSVDGQGQVTRLQLANNGLEGTIPAELGDLTTLWDLHFGSNRLRGAIPGDLGNLANLTRLVVSENREMAGALPANLTGLARLDALLAEGTGLCAPTDTAFVAWLGQVDGSRIAACDPPMVYLTQGVQSLEFPVPIIAGRKTLLRVFLIASLKTDRAIPAVRAQFYRYGLLTHTVDIPSKSGPISTVADQRRLSRSANAEIPAAVVQPGLEMVIEVDTAEALDPTLGIPTRIPETGRLAVDVRTVPVFDLTLIPFLWRSNPDSAIVELIQAMATDPTNHEMLRDARTLLPIGDLSVTAHDPVLSSSNNAFHLLGQTGAIRAIEGGTGHYMGMMAHQVTGSGGLSWTSGRVSFSQPYPEIVAHELGHNLSLAHAPCGGARYPDASLPYGSGVIGAWGYDFQGEGRVISPSTPDLMSYCDPAWISDYHFSKALRFRLQDEGADALVATRSESLLLWGGVGTDGLPYLEPTFVVDAPHELPQARGVYRLTGSTEEGGGLFSFTFAMPETADGGGSSFAFVLPVRSDWEENLASITLSGPSGSFTLDKDTDLPVVILRNPRTGQVQSILRDLPRNPLATRYSDPSRAPGLQALFSRGIPASEAWR